VSGITIDDAVPRYDKRELARGSGFPVRRATIGKCIRLIGAVNASASAADPLLDTRVAKARARPDVVGEEDRSELIDLIETISDGRESEGAVVVQARKQLSDLLFYLET
jgi:hypothetical protein